MAELKKTLLERLFAEHAGALEAFFYRRVRKHPDAAELAQEVYARMMRVADMAAIQNPEAYLYTVASNLAKEHARHEPRDIGVLDIEDPVVALVFGPPAPLELLLVNGNVVVESNELRTADADRLGQDARTAARELARRAGLSGPR